MKEKKAIKKEGRREALKRMAKLGLGAAGFVFISNKNLPANSLYDSYMSHSSYYDHNSYSSHSSYSSYTSYSSKTYYSHSSYSSHSSHSSHSSYYSYSPSEEH
jgi:hypothetical protein